MLYGTSMPKAVIGIGSRPGSRFLVPVPGIDDRVCSYELRFLVAITHSSWVPAPVAWFLVCVGAWGSRGSRAIGKGIWWMPWHREAMKDVAPCEKLRGGGSTL